VYELFLDHSYSIRFGSGAVNGSIGVYKPDIGKHALASVLSNGKPPTDVRGVNRRCPEARACDQLGQFAERDLGLKLGSQWRKQYPTIPAETGVPKTGAFIAILKDLR
jgi:hypothetical protein